MGGKWFACALAVLLSAHLGVACAAAESTGTPAPSTEAKTTKTGAAATEADAKAKPKAPPASNGASTKPAPTAKPDVAKPAAKPPAKPATTATTKAAKPKPKTSFRTEAELSALTSETSDQLHGRINLTRVAPGRQWWIKTGYGVQKTRTYSKKSVNETDIDTLTLDAQYRQSRGRGSYVFVAAAANIRNRSPHTVTYGDKTGYYMLTSGWGRTVAPGLEGEIALAKITRYEEEDDERVTPVYSLRLTRDLNDSMVLSGDTNFVQPFSEDPLVDSRVNLTYRFSPSVSMRMTYIANNMLTPVLSKTGWDKSLRVSLVFGHTRN